MAHQDSDMKIKIVLAAKKLFAEHGYDATSVRQICEEAGANVALVSYYFGGKESVFHEIFHQFFPSHKLSGLFDIEDPVEGIKAIIKEIILIRSKDPQMISLIQMEIIMASPRIEKIRSLVFPAWERVRYLLEKGRREGCYRFDSLDSTLMFVLGSIFFYKQRDFFEPLFSEPRPETGTIIQQTTTYVMNALGYQSKGE
ncbi:MULTISPECIES: TetR family transcriptional regulator [Paenibacillus]|uniref:TetR family transcriptional regulator n=1 Tax=Paenibacillus violae TaxID=3077234 RepID=A0ABU3RNW3_9BACL|nr:MULTISPECIES: TetR family transcriptional regulator [Paenibacillus]MDU0205963.1 TetR family transcriptional regulator [Paenibacillus sp. PFR10]MEC0269252.1 TetR family transcriptional regulator [Paenibacillus anseongense]